MRIVDVMLRMNIYDTEKYKNILTSTFDISYFLDIFYYYAHKYKKCAKEMKLYIFLESG